jgi:aminoglycoside phosphotransferase (APT) family kinase protein
VEKGWERSTPIVSLDAGTLARIAEAALPGQRLVSANPISGGLANTNYLLHMSGSIGPAVLRVYTRDPEACAREAAVLATVDESIPSPQVLYFDDSLTLVPHPLLVETWLPGTRLQDILGDDGLIVRLGPAIGGVAARIGAARFEAPGFFGPELPLRPSGPLPDLVTYIHDCLDSTPARKSIGDALCDQVKSFVTANRDYLDFDGSARLVHGDYKPSNLLVDTERLAVSGVLDWEFAFAGPPLYDLATLLRESDSHPPAYEAAVCAGFVEAGGVLPEDWKRRVRLLDFANLAGFLAAPGEAAGRTRDVERLLLATLRQWSKWPA